VSAQKDGRTRHRKGTVMSSVQVSDRRVLTSSRRRAVLTALFVAVVVLIAAFRCEPLKKPIPQTAGISQTAPGVALPAATRGQGALDAWRTIDVTRLKG
jgi:hypothetical protein